MMKISGPRGIKLGDIFIPEEIKSAVIQKVRIEERDDNIVSNHFRHTIDRELLWELADPRREKLTIVIVGGLHALKLTSVLLESGYEVASPPTLRECPESEAKVSNRFHEEMNSTLIKVLEDYMDSERL